MRERLVQFYESVGVRDFVEIAILTVLIYVALRLLGRTRGWSMIRGLGLYKPIRCTSCGREGTRGYVFREGQLVCKNMTACEERRVREIHRARQRDQEVPV